MIVEKIVEKIIEKPVLPPTPTSSHPPVSYRGTKGESRESKIARLTGERGIETNSKPGSRGKESRGHAYAASVVSTMTTGSERARRKNDEAWENFYIGEEDSDDDAYDRMIMGRAGARIVPEVIKKEAQGKKRSSKKALKWLGLA